MTRLADLAGTRELTINLTLRELRGKYKRSFLGWGWSLLNPVLSTGVYWVVFSLFLRIQPPVGHPSGLHLFVVFLLCGLLPWTFFQNAIDSSLEVLISNGNLIKKVYFPRQVLVAASVNALLASFLIELGVLAVVVLVVGNMVLPWIPVVLLLVVVETVFVLGIGLLLSVLNVYFRDIKHFTKIALQILFYASPIVYPIRLVPLRADILGWNAPLRRLYSLNPLVRMMACYRNVFYDLRFPALWDLAYFFTWAVGVLVLGWWVFSRLEGRLAEEV
jgi:ABC-type polysaccharide/polyol phosphate export permease